MNAYSKDLRLRVLTAVDRGTPRKEVARLFGVSLATVGRYVKRRRETPHPAAGKGTQGRRALDKAPRNRGKYTTLLASMTSSGMRPWVVVESSTTG
jgi:transposase